MRRAILLAAPFVVLALAAPAWAQARAAAPKPKQQIGFRAYMTFDWQQMAATNTFKALFDSSSFNGVGAGGEVIGLGGGLFARVSFAHMTRTGSRAFVQGGEVVSSGVPYTVALTPIDLAGGWRAQTLGGGRYTPYLGGGLVVMRYSETSTPAGSADSSGSYKGYEFFGGLDVSVWKKWLSLGVEAQYRGVPNALGTANSVSASYSETDLGGATVRVTVGFRK